MLLTSHGLNTNFCLLVDDHSDRESDRTAAHFRLQSLAGQVWTGPNRITAAVPCAISRSRCRPASMPASSSSTATSISARLQAK